MGEPGAAGVLHETAMPMSLSCEIRTGTPTVTASDILTEADGSRLAPTFCGYLEQG